MAIVDINKVGFQLINNGNIKHTSNIYMFSLGFVCLLAFFLNIIGLFLKKIGTFDSTCQYDAELHMYF